MSKESDKDSGNHELSDFYYCRDNFPLIQDVYGDKEFKNGIEDIILGIQNHRLYYALGAKPPKTFLFYGPPGTGKTFSANAIGNTVGQIIKPKEILWVPYNIGTHGTAYINMGSVKLQKVFDTGRKILRTPEYGVEKVIYWFDEADALLENRSNNHQSKEDKKLLETFMKNLQEINSNCDDEYVFMATNFKEALDPAAIRSGRVDKQLEFKMPTYNTRVVLFDAYINKTNTVAHYKVIRNYNAENLAEKADGFSFADIEQVISNSLDTKIKKELRTKPNGIIPAYWIGEKQLMSEIDIIKEYRKIDSKKSLIGFMR